MQGEYNGKSIFRHRFVAMNEDAIRDEIDRLQDEIYTLQEALDIFGRDNKELRQQVIDGQSQNEKLIRELGIKVQNLNDALDYSTPLKAQLADATEEFKIRLNELCDEAHHSKSGNSMKALTAISIINTILLFVLIGLVGYSILFI